MQTGGCVVPLDEIQGDVAELVACADGEERSLDVRQGERQ